MPGTKLRLIAQIRQLEKQAAAGGDEAQKQEEEVDSLEWQILARWQPNAQQVHVSSLLLISVECI